MSRRALRLVGPAPAADIVEPTRLVDPDRLMTMAIAGEYLGYCGRDPGNSAYVLFKRRGVRMLTRGRTRLVRKGDVDRFLASNHSNLDELAASIARAVRR